ncbi:MAG: nuclear transport factor 2 family protein [Candidatus Dormibacteria bacterium]
MPASSPQPSGSSSSATINADAEFVFTEWDRRARARDVDPLLELYAADVVFESPLVPRILGRQSGVLRGREALARFFEEGGRRCPNELVRWHRDGTYLWDGRHLSWEYLRAVPDGAQVDTAEVVELSGRDIIAHRICGAGLARRCSSTTPLRTSSEPDANTKMSIQLFRSWFSLSVLWPGRCRWRGPPAASLGCEAGSPDSEPSSQAYQRAPVEPARDAGHEGPAASSTYLAESTHGCHVALTRRYGNDISLPNVAIMIYFRRSDVQDSPIGSCRRLNRQRTLLGNDR